MKQIRPLFGKIPTPIKVKLGWHVGRTKLARNSFSRHDISHEKCSENFPEIFEPSFGGSEQIPQNSRQTSRQLSLPKIKKNPPSFCRSAGRTNEIGTSTPPFQKTRDPPPPLKRGILWAIGGFPSKKTKIARRP